MIPKQKINSFQKDILSWYKLNKRDLPWRKTRDPYSILISEVMSQQTQLSRVVLKYEAWMERFPTVETLAKASVAEVLEYWSGLGYNRRALHLKKAAESIVLNFSGEFPKTEKELMSLPGIGKYTANAVLCFAFDQQVAVVDTNIRKVILTQILNESGSRNYEFGIKEKNSSHDSKSMIHDSMVENKITEKEIEDIAKNLLPNGLAYEWNQALMDYASAVLKNEKIPIPKQSKFHGSHRYYRGQVLKQLLQKKKIAIKDLGFLIKKNYTETEGEWLKKLLNELVDEGFITINEGNVFLS